MQEDLKAALSDRILSLLSLSPQGVDITRLGQKLAKAGVGASRDAIAKELLGLQDVGEVTIGRDRRWRTQSTFGVTTPEADTPSNPIGQPISLRAIPAVIFPDRGSGIESEPAKVLPAGQLELDWALFRSLLPYYRKCLQSDGRAALTYSLDRFGVQFVLCRPRGKWWPEVDGGTLLRLDVGLLPAQFQEALARRSNDKLHVGYPLALIDRGSSRNDTGFIRPIASFAAEWQITGKILEIRLPVTAPDLNPDWMKWQRNRGKSVSAFLRQVGGASDEEGGPGSEAGSGFLDVQSFTDRLGIAIAGDLRPALAPSAIGSGIPSEAKTGVYNCIGIFLNIENRYSGGTLKELERLLDWSDEDLEATSLSAIFGTKRSLSDTLPALHPLPLGEDQLRAVHDGLSGPLTVITGPPGTGKSQVVASLMVSAALAGRSVLFASRNHKALDTVEDRLNDICGDRVLLARANSLDGSADFSFTKAIDALLSRPSVPGAKPTLEVQVTALAELDRQRWEATEEAESLQAQGDVVGGIVERIEGLRLAIGDQAADWLAKHQDAIDRKTISSARGTEVRLLFRWPIIGGWLETISNRRRVGRLSSCGIDWQAVGMETPRVPPGEEYDTFLGSAAELIELLGQLRKEEGALKLKIESFASRNRDPISISKSIEHKTKNSITMLADALENCTQEERNSLATIKGEMALNKAAGTKAVDANLEIWDAHRDTILDHFPLWAVTSLAISSRIPLLPALFDYVVIDEASQCDFATSIPLLARARTAVIVGDPQQLAHVSKLSSMFEHEAIMEAGLFKPGIGRFLYSINSLFQIAASAEPASHITLRDHYRCHPDIADYVSEAFYGRQLHVLTPEGEIRPPPRTRPGFHWTHIEGPLTKAPTGCKSRSEADAIAAHLSELLVKQAYEGTVGVVTPFAHQAEELMRRIERVVPYEALKRVQLIASTIHKFQGDARDVMLFSLCVGPDMSRGARYFVNENGRLFNVAVSRSRAVCHIFGNLHYARTCGIDHITRLAKRADRAGEQRPKRSDNIFESPWERRLYDALVARGLKPIPQFPLAGRRLDLALFKDPVKLDVEVDGERAHRDPEGLRKSSDLWRDHQIRGLGWKVRRFWVYELREDMEGCVEHVISDLT